MHSTKLQIGSVHALHISRPAVAIGTLGEWYRSERGERGARLGRGKAKGAAHFRARSRGVRAPAAFVATRVCGASFVALRRRHPPPAAFVAPVAWALTMKTSCKMQRAWIARKLLAACRSPHPS